MKKLFTILTCGLLLACGGGGGGDNESAASQPLTASQVAAITPSQIASYSDAQVVALGGNIKYLSNDALNALSAGTNATHLTGQIQSITAAQIAALTPGQVRMIGAAGPGGSVATSKILWLNSGAWAALVSNSAQVAAITTNEVATLSDGEITAIGNNIAYLSNGALGALSASTNGGHPVGQIQSISAAQITALTPAQIGVIAGVNSDKGIAFLNTGAFQSLSPAQIAILTPTQKSYFSAAQHTSCGC